MSYKKLPPGYISRSSLLVLSGGAVGFGLFEWLSGSERFHREMAMPTLHKMVSGETAHRLAVAAVKYRLLPLWGSNYREYPQLNIRIWDKQFRNPIGLAAGFDKDAQVIQGLRQSGLGFVEVGSITPLPQTGNAKPRVFRLSEDQAVINRYGFNSQGHGPILPRLREAFAVENPVLLGVNLGKNKDSQDARLDYEIGVNHLGMFCDYLVLNVSSPNTPGLRKLQRRLDLEHVLQTVKKAVDRLATGQDNRPKLLLKVSPDLSPDERQDIAIICLDKRLGVDGVIVSNTTVSRPTSLRSAEATETGGLSGQPLRQLSTDCVRDFYRLTNGKVVIIGCGGVANGQDAYDKIRAGASLVQLYTALVYNGFPVIGKVKRELVECLQRDGFACVADAIGADHKKK